MKIKTVSLATMLVVSGTFISAMFATAQAATTTNNFNVTVEPSQFEENIGAINDVWRSPRFDTDPEHISLGIGDVYKANFILDKPVKLDDDFFDGDESFKFFLRGKQGVGNSIKTFNYEFLFTGVEGGPLLTNPIQGTITTALLNPDVDSSTNINLINGGQFTFTHIQLKLTGVEGLLVFDKVSVGVDADEVSIASSVVVPEPLTILGSATALGFGSFFKRKLKSSKKDMTKPC